MRERRGEERRGEDQEGDEEGTEERVARKLVASRGGLCRVLRLGAKSGVQSAGEGGAGGGEGTGAGAGAEDGARPNTNGAQGRGAHVVEFEVAVDDAVGVEEHERERDLRGVEARAALVELARALDLEHEVAAVHVLHHEEQAVLRAVHMCVYCVLCTLYLYCILTTTVELSRVKCSDS